MVAPPSDELIFADLHAVDLTLPARLPAERSYEDIVQAYRDIEARYVPILEAAGDPRAMMLRRAVACSLFTAASAYERPIPELEAALQHTIGLGFEDPYYKALELGAFAGECASRGQGDIGLPYLDEVIAELEALVESGQSERKHREALRVSRRQRNKILLARDAADEPPTTIDNPIARRRISVADDPQREIVAVIGPPEPDPAGDWRCWFQVMGLQSAPSEAHGIDGLAAVLSAVHGVEATLAVAGYMTGWEEDGEGAGIPSFVPSSLPVEMQRDVNRYIRERLRENLDRQIEESNPGSGT